ncbi:MAG: hypothetical protein NT158_08840 [Cyanobacteria bacterium]|nr:hypothetical protein [Cyanobacteriota bacterium]
MRTVLEPQIVAESSLRISLSVKLMEEVLKKIPSIVFLPVLF